MRFEQRLSQHADTLTVAERRVANHIMAHLQDLPFETAASLGLAIGVSAMTVGRFLKAMGYDNLSDLKAELRQQIGDVPWLTVDALASIDPSNRLATEIEAIAAVHQLATTKVWGKAVEMLASATNVYVGGFDAQRGLASMFAGFLDSIRPGVRLGEGCGTQIVSILGAQPGLQNCAILIDTRRYSTLFRRSAELVAKSGVRLILVTDQHCPWGFDMTDTVLSAETRLGHFWDASSALCSLLNLLIDDVARKIGGAVQHRLDELAETHQLLIGFEEGFKAKRRRRPVQENPSG